MAAKNKATTASPSDRIAELVEKRDHLRELESLTQAAPRAFEEAVADIPRVIELLAERCQPQVSWLGQSAAGAVDLERQLSQQDSEYSPIPAASLLAWAMPEALTGVLQRDLEAAYSELPSPMPASQKAAELAKFAREVATVEAELAEVWWAAVDGGLQLDVPPIDGATLIGLTDR